MGIRRNIRNRQSLALLALISISSLQYQGVNSFSNLRLKAIENQCTAGGASLQQSTSSSSSEKTKFSSPVDKSDDTSKQQQQQQQQPPPVVKDITDERNEYKLNLGKALDTLRSDYPKIFEACPDFSIYHQSLEVIDPSGVTLHGLNNYKNFFRVLRGIVSFFYCADKSNLTFRLVYDWARSSIRVAWHVTLIPKAIYGGVRNPLYVDGVSVYETNNIGVITQHRVEHLLLNDKPAMTPNGIFHAINREAQSVPVLGVDGILHYNNYNSFSSDAATATATTGEHEPFNKESFEQRNTYRKKYGLKPLTPDEFIEIEQKTRLLEQETKLKREQLTQAAAATANKQKQRNRKGLFSSLFENTCESNFDCERPEVCCDLIVKKVCCSTGVKVHSNGVMGQRALVPVPARPDGSPGDLPRY